MSSRFLLILLKDDNEAGSPKAGPELLLWISQYGTLAKAFDAMDANNSVKLSKFEMFFFEVFDLNFFWILNLFWISKFCYVEDFYILKIF